MTRAWQRGELAPPWRLQLGALLAGLGAFNLFDALVNHFLLGIHHLRDDLGGPIGWDVGYLIAALLVTLAGWAMIRSRRAGETARA